MNLAEAQEQAATGKAVHYSTNGGRKRYLRFRATLAHRDGAEGIITAVAYGKPIAVFTAEGVRLDSWGHRHSITTREAMNYCLSSPGFVYSRDNVIYAGSQPFTDGMVIPYPPAKATTVITTVNCEVILTEHGFYAKCNAPGCTYVSEYTPAKHVARRWASAHDEDR